MHLSKLIKLPSKNLCILLYVNYISIKKRRFLSTLLPPLLPFPEETLLTACVSSRPLSAHRHTEKHSFRFFKFIDF